MLVGLVAITYWPTLNNGFVSDDNLLITGTDQLHSLAGLRDIWFKLGATPQYYPLAHSVQWIEWQSWKLDPRGYHAVNMMLHAAVALLLWRLLTRLEVRGAWLAAAIFAVHPVQVETVAWASELKNLLSAVLAIGSLLSYFRFSPADELPPGKSSKAGPWGYYALSLALYIGAVLSKSVTASTPAVILVIFWWKRGQVEWREARRLAPFFAIGCALACVTVWLEKSVIREVGPEWDFGLLERLLIAGRAVWFYAGKLVWPYPLVFNYPRWQVDAYADWQYLYPAAAIALVVILGLLQKRIGRGPLAAVLIFGGVLLPTLGFFDVYWFLSSFVADHFQYHASMALIPLVVAVAMQIAGLSSPRGYLVGLVASTCLIVLLAAMAHQKTHAYKDDETLIRDNVALTPSSWAARKNLGNWLSNHGQPEQAIVQHRAALRLFPMRTRLHNSIGVSLMALGRLDEAAIEFKRALEGTSGDEQQYTAHFHLLRIMKAQQRLDEAGAHAAAAMELAVRMAPKNAQYREDAGATFLALGKLAPAEEHLRQAIELNPLNANAHNLLGELFVKRGDRPAAVVEFRAALAIDRNHAAAKKNLESYGPGSSPTSPP